MLLVLSLAVAACGGKESVASKSADAYRDAQTKGTPAGGGHEHGGPAATATTAEVDHSAHGTSAGTMATMDHSAHGTGTDPHAGMHHGAGSNGAAMDHSAHGAAGAHAETGGHAAMDHGTTADAHAGHDALAATPAAAHAQHRMPQPAVQTVSAAPLSNAEMQRIRPAATLSGDAFDAPAPLSVSEAAKAAQGGSHEGHQR
jgi:hypothetical protein